jgi:hypothetical protein
MLKELLIILLVLFILYLLFIKAPTEPFSLSSMVGTTVNATKVACNSSGMSCGL